MKEGRLLPSLTRSSYAAPSTGDVSTRSQVQWKSRNYRIDLLDHHMLFQLSTTCPHYLTLNETPDPSPFTYSIIICYSNNNRPARNITGSMNVHTLLHSLTRSAYAMPTIEHLSTISQVEWTARVYSIHLHDYHMPFQQSTTCPQYHRFNECPETSPFTNSIIVRYSKNRRPVHNITGWMNGQSLFHSLTRLSYAIPRIDHLSTISQVEWTARVYSIHSLDYHMLFQQSTTCPQYHRFNEGPDTTPFTYSIIICHSKNRRPVHNITRSMNGQSLFHSLTRLSYAIPRIDHLSTISQVEWTARVYSIHLLDHHLLFQPSTICTRYHRLNESRETTPFTHSIVICYSNNRRPVHNITGSMKVQIRLLSLTRSSYAILRIDDLSTISHVQCTARFYSIHLLDYHMLFQESTTCPQYHSFNVRRDSIPFTYSIIICHFKNRRPVHNITRSMYGESRVYSLTRSSYAFPTIDELSTISHVKWKNGDYCIHLLDYRMPFQQSTTCPQYNRFNECSETAPFTNSIIVCYSNNRRPVHNITR
jgi:hypothetical protein